MPKNEPDHTDPLELTGVAFDDPSGRSLHVMAECFAGEFLRLGHTPSEVMELFRSPVHRLAHLAWCELGDVAVFAMVNELASDYAQFREVLRRSREARAARPGGA